MRIVVWVLIAALVVLHQDFWWWTDGTLILGAIPIGLAYHIGLSIAASLVWLLAVRYAWPEEPDTLTDSHPMLEPAAPRSESLQGKP